MLGVTSYGDLSQFAQQQSRASAFILSIDDEEFTPGPDLDPAVLNLRQFIEQVRRKNADVPIYVYGETKTSRHIPNDILRELHGFIHMYRGHAGIHGAPHHPRGQELPGRRSSRRSSRRCSTTRRTAPIPGTARGTPAASRS